MSPLLLNNKNTRSLFRLIGCIYNHLTEKCVETYSVAATTIRMSGIKRYSCIYILLPETSLRYTRLPDDRCYKQRLGVNRLSQASHIASYTLKRLECVQQTLARRSLHELLNFAFNLLLSELPVRLRPPKHFQSFLT